MPCDIDQQIRQHELVFQGAQDRKLVLLINMENERIKLEIGECQDIALGVPLQGLLDQQSENRLQRHENDEPPPTAMPISSSTPLLDVPINEENEDAQLGSGQDTISQNRDVNEHPNVARQSQSMSNIVATNSGHSSSTHPPFQVRDSPQLQITRQNLLAQAQRIPSHESMRHTEYCGVHRRLQSFCHWPSGHLVDKESLADAGFFYLGNRDECRCHYCGVNLLNWEAGDDAFVEHAFWSPHCSYLRQRKGEAFVKAVEELAQLGGRVTKEDVERRLQLGSGQGTISQDRHVNEDPNVARQSQSLSNIGTTNSGHSSSTHPPFQVRDSPQLQITRQILLAQAQRIPSQESMRHTEYWGVHRRLQSFCHWPADHLVDKESLADAGFFYLGNRDECRCHHCGVNLHNWEAGDDAFVEHALWSPQCPYLRRQKGEAFVKAVKELQQLGGRVTKEEVERRLQENAGLVQENLLNDETVEQDPLPVGNTEGEQSQVEQQDESVIQATIQLRDRNTERNPCPEALFCRICRDSRVRVLLLPCFHLVVCSGCASSCQRCPVCYQPIQTRLNVQLRDTADEAD